MFSRTDDDQWANLCANDWTDDWAKSVCIQLGFEDALESAKIKGTAGLFLNSTFESDSTLLQEAVQADSESECSGNVRLACQQNSEFEAISYAGTINNLLTLLYSLRKVGKQ